MLRRRPGARDGDERDDARGATHGSHSSMRDHECGARSARPGAHDAQEQRLKVPHMGWNLVNQHHEHPLWTGIDNHEHFYFVHSYYVNAADDAQVFGTTQYGSVSAHVAIGRDATFAVQFHPEKSSRAGLRLLENFVTWTP